MTRSRACLLPARSTAHAPATEKDIEIHVQQRIEEEHADIVERQVDIPREKLAARYRFPTIDLLDAREADEVPIDYDELEENKRILLDKLDTYGIEIRDINAIVGPTVTLYELTPAPWREDKPHHSPRERSRYGDGCRGDSDDCADSRKIRRGC